MINNKNNHKKNETSIKTKQTQMTNKYIVKTHTNKKQRK